MKEGQNSRGEEEGQVAQVKTHGTSVMYVMKIVCSNCSDYNIVYF